MPTEYRQAPNGAIQGAFHGTSSINEQTIHPPLDHVDVGAGTISAGIVPPSSGDAGLDHETLRAMYRSLALARAVDERIWQVNRAGKAPFAVSGQGHEAAQVGAAYALDRDRDVILPYYRDLALCMVFGLSARDIMMSVFAKSDDPSSGARQMPSHFGSARHRIISASSPVATHVPHATGTAYAAKVLGTGAVSLTSFGEGGSSKGDVHEAFNFAAIHKLPVIFFCQNNRYAISVPQDRQMAIDNVADRAAAYGFPGFVVDGTDLLAVYQVVSEAAERARRGDGPTLIEAKVYRFTPHTSDDDDRSYRDPEEVKAWKARDPLTRFAERLADDGALDEEARQAIQAEIRTEVNEATAAADAAPFPDPATFDRYVYAEY